MPSSRLHLSLEVVAWMSAVCKLLSSPSRLFFASFAITLESAIKEVQGKLREDISSAGLEQRPLNADHNVSHTGYFKTTLEGSG